MSYGWQVFVECYDQKDWIRFVAEMSSFEEAEDNLRRLVALHDDQYADAQNEIL